MNDQRSSRRSAATTKKQQTIAAVLSKASARLEPQSSNTAAIIQLQAADPGSPMSLAAVDKLVEDYTGFRLASGIIQPPRSLKRGAVAAGIMLPPLDNQRSAHSPNVRAAAQVSRYATPEAPSTGTTGNRTDLSDEDEEKSEQARHLKGHMDPTREAEGLRFVERIHPLLKEGTRIPLKLQECLVHMVLNADHQRTDLAQRALSLLKENLERHPPAKLQITEDLGLVIKENPDLWMFKTTTRGADNVTREAIPEHLELWRAAPGPAQPCNFLGMLFRHALAMVGPAGTAKDGSKYGSGGHVLLLRYMVDLLSQDLRVRLAALSASQQVAGPSGGSEQEKQSRVTAIRGSRLLSMMGITPGWRLKKGKPEPSARVGADQMQTEAWGASDRGKKWLVETLIFLIIYSSNVKGNQGSQPGSPAATDACSTPNAANTTGAAGGASPVSVEEVNQLGRTMLRCLFEGWTAAEEVGIYKSDTGASCNDRCLLDHAILEKMPPGTANFELREWTRLQRLFSALPHAACLRLLATALATSGAKRLNGVERSTMDGLSPSWEQLNVYYLDYGKYSKPPQISALELLVYLDKHFKWAAKQPSLGGKEICAVYVISIVIAAVATSPAEDVDGRQKLCEVYVRLKAKIEQEGIFGASTVAEDERQAAWKVLQGKLSMRLASRLVAA